MSISVADREEFLAHLPEDGSAVTNPTLRERLGWDSSRYQQVRDDLLKTGDIRIGRGRGGLVRLASAAKGTKPDAASSSVSQQPTKGELGLYADFQKGLEKWAHDQAWTNHFVEQVANQGRRKTGGVWTRPDFVVVGVQKYDYTPGVIRDIETFEVKLATAGPDAVFETAAHSRFATKSHLCIERKKDQPTEETLTRIESECQRFGLGLILFAKANDPDSWEYLVDPVRREPDPDQAEQFMNDQVLNRTKLRQWL